MKQSAPLPAWTQFALAAFTGAALIGWELTRSLRGTRRESKVTHTARNLAIAGAAVLVTQYAERPLAMRTAGYVAGQDLGLVAVFANHTALRTFASVLLLDYGLYVWHVLTHKVPFLWRFHLVHHVDLDLDASTALRFHFGEMLLSVPWRLMQIRLAGASPFAVSVWQSLLTASILFHHSNVRLPPRVERALGMLIMTPRLHDIHHRADLASTHSNWSSGLAVWDLLHGTYRTQAAGTPIGVPAWQDPDDVRLSRCFTLPFEKQREDFTALR